MKREIKRSRTLRSWHRYKNIIMLALAILIVVIIAIVLIAKAVGSDKEPTTAETESTIMETTTQAPTEPPTEETTQETTTMETTTAAPTDIVKTPAEETFENEAFFQDAMFLGDTFVAGIDLYQFVGSSKLAFDTNWTVGKAKVNGVSKLASANPSKVFIELGINDLNYPKTGAAVYESYVELVEDIKSKLPNTQIYILSVFPISSGYEARENVQIKNSEVTALNELLSQMEGVTFLNINKSISNSDGSLMTDLTTDGLHIKKSYIAFILNLIVDMCQ